MIPDDTQWPEWAEELRRRCLMLWSWLTNDRCECGQLWGDLLHGRECCERFGATKVGGGAG